MEEQLSKHPNFFRMEFQEQERTKRSPRDTAEAILQGYSESKEKVPGYGHPTHTKDPRTTKLLEIADQTRLRGPHVELAEIIESLTEKFFSQTPDLERRRLHSGDNF